MKLKWSNSVYKTDNVEKDKEFITDQLGWLNEHLKLFGYIFLNDVIWALGFTPCRRGQYDGWIWDELDPNGQVPIKIKIKSENGDLVLILNEEKDIVNQVFPE